MNQTSVIGITTNLKFDLISEKCIINEKKSDFPWENLLQNTISHKNTFS